MASKVILVVFYIFLSVGFRPLKAQSNWVRVGYYRRSFYTEEFPISNINSSVFTHLICGFAGVNSTTYQLSFSSTSEELLFTNFTDIVKQMNPSIITLLSVGCSGVRDSTFSTLLSNGSHRKSFIDSSIKIARLYGFQGLDLCYFSPNTSFEMFNMGTLFREWRAATVLEARNSGQSLLILTALFNYPHQFGSASYPIDSIQKYLDWIHLYTSDYNTPTSTNFTWPSAALYDPASVNNTDNIIRAWIDGGLSSNKLVFCLPFSGYAWTLANIHDNGIGAPATGPANNNAGAMTYHHIKKNFMEPYRPTITYNATYVVNYFTIGTSWISFDGVEVVRTKISYAKQKRLLGYFVWEVYMDDNWELSQAAAQLEVKVNSSALVDNKIGKSNSRMVIIIWTTTATATILILGFLMYCCWLRKLKIKGTMDKAKQSTDEVPNAVAAGDFNKNVANLTIYTLVDTEEATDRFSFENKLGEGGFGPVYKGILADGKEIAVKKLSKTSKQGFEEFKNEVMLTAKLQHINLVRLLGYCIDREQQMLIYEYLPNKSLDSYLFDPIRRYILDWKKRVHIIEGVTQGLMYLQEYSRLTIIHRDLKVSNVLLDENWVPKISDFGMARIFAKDDLEANTSRVVGTLGYVSPEYIQKGMYSTKSDVYSFGVLLLQIISGKRISLLYGPNESLSLPNYAYELWKDGKGIEFIDLGLDDTYCSCKLMRCLQIALLCVQENPNDRPSMLEVFSMLKNETIDMMIPKKPAFSKQNDGQEGKKCTLQLEGYSGSTSSINDITVSEVIAR